MNPLKQLKKARSTNINRCDNAISKERSLSSPMNREENHNTLPKYIIGEKRKEPGQSEFILNGKDTELKIFSTDINCLLNRTTQKSLQRE